MEPNQKDLNLMTLGREEAGRHLPLPISVPSCHCAVDYLQACPLPLRTFRNRFVAFFILA